MNIKILNKSSTTRQCVIDNTELLVYSGGAIYRRNPCYGKIPKWIKLSGNGRRRKYVSFGGKKYILSRIVATAWIENPEKKREIHHVDGNPENNHYTNLRWVTHQENQQLYWKDKNLVKKRDLGNIKRGFKMPKKDRETFRLPDPDPS